MRILIVGGGFAGMSAAIQLRKIGAAVDLVELDPCWRVQGAGLTLTAATLRAFVELGVLNAFLEHGFASEGGEFFTASRERIAAPPHLVRPDVPPVGAIMQPVLASILADATRASRICVRLGATFTEIVDQADGTIVTLTDGTTDLARYADLTRRFGVPVVDAAASLGTASADDRGFGTGFGGSVVYSMHATKSFSAGEGGLIYSADRDAIAQLRQMCNFGFGEPRIATMPGLNAKLSEVSALLAHLRLDSFAEVLAHRTALMRGYRQALPELAFQPELPGTQAHQFAPGLLRPALAPFRGEITAALARQGIGSATYFSPHLAQQGFFAQHGIWGELPVTNDVAGRIVSLPLFDGMTRLDLIEVTSAARRELARAARAASRRVAAPARPRSSPPGSPGASRKAHCRGETRITCITSSGKRTPSTIATCSSSTTRWCSPTSGKSSSGWRRSGPTSRASPAPAQAGLVLDHLPPANLSVGRVAGRVGLRVGVFPLRAADAGRVPPRHGGGRRGPALLPRFPVHKPQSAPGQPGSPAVPTDAYKRSNASALPWQTFTLIASSSGEASAHAPDSALFSNG